MILTEFHYIHSLLVLVQLQDNTFEDRIKQGCAFLWKTDHANICIMYFKLTNLTVKITIPLILAKNSLLLKTLRILY